MRKAALIAEGSFSYARYALRLKPYIRACSQATHVHLIEL